MPPQRAKILTVIGFLLGSPGISLGQTLASLTLSPPAVQGGSNSTGQIGLSAAAPAGGLAITLASSNPAAASVPASASVSGGVSTVSFPVTTYPVAQSMSVTITAIAGRERQAVQLMVLAPTVVLSSVEPTSIIGGQPVVMNMLLNSPAPEGGMSIQISSSNTAVVPNPPPAVVGAGNTRPTPTGGKNVEGVTVTTAPVGQSTAVTLTATTGGASRTALLTVLPATVSGFSPVFSTALGGQTFTIDVLLTGRAPEGGREVQLSTDNPAVVAVPSSVTVGAGESSKNFTGTTTPVAQTTLVPIRASALGTTKSASVRVDPPKPSSVTFTPSGVMGGTSATALVTLNGPAPPSGLVASLSSVAPGAADVPATITFGAGSSSKSFTVSTTPVPSPVNVAITATTAGGTSSGTLAVATAALTSLTMSPNSIRRGGDSTGQLTLTGPAPPGGRFVQLSVSNPGLAAVNGSFTIPPGATTGSFTVLAAPIVTGSATVTITATSGGVTRTAQLTINP